MPVLALLAGALAASLARAAAAPGAAGEARVVDAFESMDGWSARPADGVEMKLSSDAGLHGRALRVDFRFVKGGGYAVLHRDLALELPGNYRFTFALRGECRPNNLEFKLVDSTGSNVWWCNRRDFQFPRAWETVAIKRRQIQFAWGPAGGGEIRHVAALELAVTAGSGGAGTVWLDDLELAALPPAAAKPPPMLARASSARPGHGAALAADGDSATFWQGTPGDSLPWVVLDLQEAREFGGLVIDWAAGGHPGDYVVEASSDSASWRVLRAVPGGRRARDPLYLPESEARFVRVRATRAGRSCAIREIALRPLEWSATREAFFQALAREAPRGSFPRGLSGEQTYWTVVSVDGGRKKGLMSEDGAIETGRGAFSIEPFVYADGKLVTWADVEATHDLDQDVPIPLVQWRASGAHPGLGLEISAVAFGAPDSSSILASYLLTNSLARARHATLYLALRPFQVNPPAQFLNTPGGTAPILELALDGRRVRVNVERVVECLTAPSGFGALTFDQGDIVDELRAGRLPAARRVRDPFAAASGALAFTFDLPPRGAREVAVVVPLEAAPPNAAPPRAASPRATTSRAASPHAASPRAASPHAASPRATLPRATPPRATPPRAAPPRAATVGAAPAAAARPGRLAQIVRSSAPQEWRRRMDYRGVFGVGRPRGDSLPNGWVDDLVPALKRQLGWILATRAGPALQPGARAYARSWIRDGALISSALLRLGHAPEVREFIEWFAPYQYDDGKVPCCVDQRGADPVPEHDSGGEFIFLVAEYCRFTGDRALAERLWPRVRAAAGYLDSLRRERRTAEWRAPGKAAFFGLLPPSISHEGYSAKPMHSYWDDFFALRGFKDAAYLAQELGQADDARRLGAIRDTFARDLGASVRAAMALHKIDYVPGCADLGDFDATSTAIALSPAQAEGILPRGALEQTFERYWTFFSDRRDGRQPWEAFTPYELRTVGAFVRLGWRQRALEMLEFFLAYCRPEGWLQWPEVVWKDPRSPRFLGDLPHAWVAAEYIRSVLDLFAYDREADQSLVIGAGIPKEWTGPLGYVDVFGLRTPYGPLAYTVTRQADAYEVRILQGLRVPPGGIAVRAPFDGPIRRATVDGHETAPNAAGEVIVRAVPARVVLEP